MVFVIDRRHDITLEAARRVGWHAESVSLSDRSVMTMTAARARFMDILESDPEVTIYGVTTGMGQQAKRKLTPGERKAQAKLEAVAGDEGLLAYTLSYEEPARRLTIRFRKDFPHELESWEEVYTSGWGAGAQELVTRGTRQKRILLDYWTHNSLSDGELRQQLDLP